MLCLPVEYLKIVDKMATHSIMFVIWDKNYRELQWKPVYVHVYTSVVRMYEWILKEFSMSCLSIGHKLISNFT